MPDISLNEEIAILKRRLVKISSYIQAVENRLFIEADIPQKEIRVLRSEYKDLRDIQINCLEFIRKYLVQSKESGMGYMGNDVDQETIDIAKKLRVLSKTQLEQVKEIVVKGVN